MVLPNENDQAETTADLTEANADFVGFLDIPVTLRTELGRRRYRCERLVGLRVGSVITLERSAGENVALLLNGSRIGDGEIVVIDESMGLRITNIGAHEPGSET